MGSPEQVVLLDDDGRAIGVADKATVHGASTPLHLAFSCYGFDREGRLLVTRRARHKATFPGVQTNTCCGHPAPGEAMEDAVRRRLAEELGVGAVDLRLVLPDFAYRAAAGGVEENEVCPVYVCTLVGEPRARPDEVESVEWWSWEAFVAAAGAGELSPWAQLQVPLLDARLSDWRLVPPAESPPHISTAQLPAEHTGEPPEHVQYEDASPAHPAETWIRRYTQRTSGGGH